MKKLKKGDTITILGRRWFERVNGNTYHSVDVYVNGEMIGQDKFSYGYGNQYEQTAQDILEKLYKLPLETYPNGNKEMLWRIKDHGINYVSTVSDVQRKKDL